MNDFINAKWIAVTELDAIPRLGSRVLERKAGNIAIFRTENDEVFAVLDECPHKKGPLSQGIVCGKKVACPLHNWHILLESGLVQEPDEGSVKTFPIKIEDGTIYIAL